MADAGTDATNADAGTDATNADAGTDATNADAGMDATDADARADAVVAESLTGVAAEGAPVVAGTVDAVCQNGAVAATATTGSDGAYELEIDAGVAPCVVRLVKDDLTFYSFTATDTGVANLTPFTDMILALAFDASGLVPATWYETPSDWATLTEEIADAETALAAALTAAGYPLPGGFAPLTAKFSAFPGDTYDDLLEAIAQSIEDDPDVADYAAFRMLFVASEPLPQAPDMVGNGLPAPDGDGAALGGLDGATGTIGDTTYTYTRFEDAGNVEWGAGNPERTVFNFTAFSTTDSGTVEALKVWRINGFPPAPGTYACAGIGELPSIVLATGSGNLLAESCTVEIIKSEGATVTGRFSGKFGEEVMTDGYFEVKPNTGGGDALPPGEVGASFKVDGMTYRYENATAGGFETYEVVNASPTSQSSPGHPVGVQLHTIPNEPGTYECDETYDGNAYRKVNVWFWWNGVNHTAGQRQNPSPGPDGSSCTITLDKVGDTIEGSFSGTFVGENPLVVTEGLFRYIAP